MRSLSKSFGGLKAVSDVSFKVRKGAILGIIGPNGAGKTTVFNLINGFIRPDDGEVMLFGRNMIGAKPHVLAERALGRTFQIMRPFARMTVAENVLVGAYVHAADQDEAIARAKAAIRRVGTGGVGRQDGRRPHHQGTAADGDCARARRPAANPAA